MAADTWPSASIGTTNVDQGSDTASNARADILDCFQKVNQLIAARNVADGIPSLDSDGFMPQSQLRPAAVLAQLLTVDGAASGLDADLLDGLQGEAYLLVDGTRAMITAESTGWTVRRDTTTNNARARALTLLGHNTPGATTTGYGIDLYFEGGNAAGTPRAFGALGCEWTTATASYEDADLVVQLRSNGTLGEVLRVKDTMQLEWAEIGTPASQPAAGKRWLYFKSGGLAMKDSGGTETLFAAATGSDHNALSNLTVGDPHTQYVRTDGSRVMTGDLQVSGALITDLALDPAAPASGKILLYSKGQGLYYRLADTTVIGPLLTGGVVDHGALTGLTDDDHTQYLLRQPTADVVLNEAGGDFDWRLEAVGLADFWRIDAGDGVMALNVTGTLSNILGRLQVVASTAVGIRSAVTSGTAFSGSASAGTVFTGLITSGAGAVGNFSRSADATPVVPVLLIEDASSYGFRTLWVKQAVTGAQAARFDTAVGEVLTINAGELTVNEGGGNFDVRIEGDTKTSLVFVDASADVVNINGTSTAARFNVGADGLDGIYCAADTNGKAAVIGESTTGSSYGLYGKQTGTNATGYALRCDASRGVAGYFYKDLGGAAAGAEAVLASAVVDNTDPAHCLELSQLGTGDLIYCLTESLLPALRLTKTGGFYIAEQGADMTAPAGGSGLWALYFKSDGLYVRDDTGAVTGPLGTGGGVSPGGWTDDGDVVRLTTVGDQVGIGTASPAANSRLHVLAQTATDVPLVIQSATSQTGHLQDWRSSGGTAISFVSASGGYIHSPLFDTSFLQLNGSVTGYSGFMAAPNSATVTYVLPAADGTSGQVLTTNGSSTLSWTDKGTGGGPSALSAITNATGINTIDNGVYAQAWRWALGNTGNTAFTFMESAPAASGSSILVDIAAATTSTATPLKVSHADTGFTAKTLDVVGGAAKLQVGSLAIGPNAAWLGETDGFVRVAANLTIPAANTGGYGAISFGDMYITIPATKPGGWTAAPITGICTGHHMNSASAASDWSTVTYYGIDHFVELGPNQPNLHTIISLGAELNFNYAPRCSNVTACVMSSMNNWTDPSYATRSIAFWHRPGGNNVGDPTGMTYTGVFYVPTGGNFWGLALSEVLGGAYGAQVNIPVGNYCPLYFRGSSGISLHGPRFQCAPYMGPISMVDAFGDAPNTGAAMIVGGSDSRNVSNWVQDKYSLAILGSSDSGGTWTGRAAFYRLGGMLLMAQAAPVETRLGAIYVDSDDSKLYFHNGSNWIDLTTGTGGTTALSSLTAAAAAHTIDNTTYAQTWQWALGATGYTGFKITESTPATDGGGTTLMMIETLTGSGAQPFTVIGRAPGSVTTTVKIGTLENGSILDGGVYIGTNSQSYAGSGGVCLVLEITGAGGTEFLRTIGESGRQFHEFREAGELRFYAPVSGNGWIQFKAPATFDNQTTYLWPTGPVSGTQVLQCDGTGQMSWGSPGSGGWDAVAGNIRLTTVGDRVLVGVASSTEAEVLVVQAPDDVGPVMAIKHYGGGTQHMLKFIGSGGVTASYFNKDAALVLNSFLQLEASGSAAAYLEGTTTGANLILGGGTALRNSSMRNGLALGNGVAPAAYVANVCQVYAKDAAAGKSWLWFRAEDDVERVVVGTSAFTAADTTVTAVKLATSGTKANNDGWLTVHRPDGTVGYVPIWDSITT